jgi:restriction endonuclease S subunit
MSSHSALKLYPKGSLAIAMYGATIGRLGMLGVDATVNQACCVFSNPTVFDIRFVYYWLWMQRPILISFSNGGGQPNLSQDDLKKIWIPIPCVEEQQAITRFLNFKTAKIDALIAKKQSLLDKLAEKRSALISHAVTKGLDSSVPMKDSGVTWLQDIPRYWGIKRLKFSVDLINNKISAEESSLPYLGLEHIESWTGKKIDGEINNSEGLASSFLSGDILFCKLRPYLAKVHLAQQDGLISSEALVIRSKTELYGEYLKFYMLSRDFINVVDSSTYGSKMPRASWDFIGNIPVLLPGIEEQQTVARFLDSKIDLLDKQARRSKKPRS